MARKRPLLRLVNDQEFTGQVGLKTLVEHDMQRALKGAHLSPGGSNTKTALTGLSRWLPELRRVEEAVMAGPE